MVAGRWTLLVVLIAAVLAGCPTDPGGGPPGPPGDDDDDTTAGDDDTTAGDDDTTEDPPPDPEDVDPCENGSCWDTSLIIQACHTNTLDEDFSTGLYNVHRVRVAAAADAETRVRLTRTGGDWQPALLVTDLDGTTLSDGEVGLVEPGLEVHVLESGREGDAADVWITPDQDRDLDVFVTGWAAVDSDFAAYQPQDASYTLQVESVCEGGEPLDCTGPTVNGHAVAEPACSWLEYLGRDVVPALAGSREERLDIASIVAWWSLKEGVLFLDNPIVYSHCAFESGSEYIDPLETCPEGRAWQVGIAGIQVPTFLDDRPSDQAALLYPSLTEDEVLEATAIEALVTAPEVAGVVASSGSLRVSWLLRNSAIGVSLQVALVENECIDGSYDWCFGSGWTATALYAPDKPSALQSIADIRAIFDQLAP